MPTKWHCWFWDRGRAVHVIARKVRQNALICCLWWLEVKDCNENWREGGHGHCRQDGVGGFGIAGAARVIAPAHTYLQFMGTRSEGLQ